MYDDELELPPTDLEIAQRIMLVSVKEAIFQSSRASLEVEEILAAVFLAWAELRGSVPGWDAMEQAHRLALAVLGASEDELDAEGPVVPESHLESIINTSEPEPEISEYDELRKRLGFGGTNKQGLFRA
jgi:hypothetical protein